MKAYISSLLKLGTSLFDVTRTQVAWLLPLFRRSDSSLLKLRLHRLTGMTGYNSQNTYGVAGAGLYQDQAPSLLKADGAGSMTPKRSRQLGSDYFRVAGGVS